MAKTKTITVYEEGDIVYSSYMSGTFRITDKYSDLEYEGTNIDDNNETFHLEHHELRLLTKKELKTLQASRLSVDTLDEAIQVHSDHVEVGCRRISLPDAKKIGEFLSKIKVPKAKKKTTKKGKR